MPKLRIPLNASPSLCRPVLRALAVAAATTVLAACGGSHEDAAEPAKASALQADTAPSASYTVRAFNFTDASTYSLRYFYSTNVRDAAGLTTYYDLREQRSGGLPVADLYDSAVYAGPLGWRAVDGATPNTSTASNPNESTYGQGYTYVTTHLDTDVSGLPLADALALVQDLMVNTSSTVAGVTAATLPGTMPAGAKVRRLTSVGTATPVGYRESDGFIGKNVTTLAGMVGAFPVPTGAITTSNSVSMGGLHGSAGCGATVCLQERLRAAFGAANAVTYYLCDVNTSSGVQSNCVTAGTGSYSLATAADGRTPILTFAALPSATGIQTFTRVFVARNGHVYFGFQDKPGTSVQSRLNQVAFEALAAVLGITPPAISETPSAFAGTWSTAYAGSDTGTCAAVAINAIGQLLGNCKSTLVGGSFVASGVLTPDGDASFGASGGSTTSGAAFQGSFTGNTAAGSWVQAPAGRSGTWAAAKL